MVKTIFYLEKSLSITALPLMTIIEAKIVIVPSEFNRQNLYGFSITKGKNMKDIASRKTPEKKTTKPT